MIQASHTPRLNNIFRILWLQAQRTAKSASPIVPFSGHRDRRPVGLHVADLGLDGASAVEVGDQPGRQDASIAADRDAGLVLIVAPLAAINDRQICTLVGEDLGLTQRFSQSVSVIRITCNAAHADNKSLVQRGAHADLAAKLMCGAGFSLEMPSTSGSYMA